MAHAQYVKWSREDGLWVGRARKGAGQPLEQILSIETAKRAGKRVTYLYRPNQSHEACKNIEHAKSYGNELARLWNYAPLTNIAQLKEI